MIARLASVLLTASVVVACAPEEALEAEPSAIRSETADPLAATTTAAPPSPGATPAPSASPTPSSTPTPTPSAPPGPPACLPLRVQARIDGLIADLGSPTYSVREAAQRELATMFCGTPNRCIAEYFIYRTQQPIPYQADVDRAEVDRRLALLAKECNSGCDWPRRALVLRSVSCQYDFPAKVPPAPSVSNYRCRFSPARPVDCQVRADIDNHCSRDGTLSLIQNIAPGDDPVHLTCPNGNRFRLTTAEVTAHLGQYFPNGAGCPLTARLPFDIATSQSQTVTYPPPASERDHCSNLVFDPAAPNDFHDCAGLPSMEPEDTVRADLLAIAPPRACKNVERTSEGQEYDACIPDELYTARCGGM